MEYDYSNALKILMSLPEDISIKLLNSNQSLGYALVMLEYEGNNLPAVFSFRMMRLDALRPLRLDVYSKKVGAPLNLLSTREDVLDYNMVLSINFPYSDSDVQVNKIRQLFKYDTSL